MVWSNEQRKFAAQTHWRERERRRARGRTLFWFAVITVSLWLLMAA